MGSYPQKCSYEEEKVRPGYVRPGLTVDEAYRRWNMRLVRERKKLYREKMNALTNELTTDLCPWCMHEGQWIAVHGHYQCEKCGKNVSECCNGEIIENGS